MVTSGPLGGGEGRLEFPGSRESQFSMAPGPPASPGPLLPASPWQQSSCCICGSHCGYSPQLTPLNRTSLPGGLSFLASSEGQHSEGMYRGSWPHLAHISMGCGPIYVHKSLLTEATRGPWSLLASYSHRVWNSIPKSFISEAISGPCP